MTTNDNDQALIDKLGFDRLPTDIIEKRVADLLDLRGKKAVVTGAGGQGLGQACANRLAGCGADVAMIDINLEGAKQNAELVSKRWGTKAIPLQADLSDWDAVHRVMKESHDALGGIDILINNPVMVVGGAFEKHTKAEIDLTVLGSLTMVMYGCHAVLDYMLAQGSGRIVNIASVGGRLAHPGLAVYNACKSGVIGLTRNLAYEYSSRGIRVMGVAPGIMINPSLKDIVLNPNEKTKSGRDSILTAIENVHVGRVSIPEEVANMVAYVVSDAASYMVGNTINVAGGQAMI
ncbi:SDR family oxidoreductase [Pseudenhygromyxa sp. WMMC2535]|uniref:SDR family NAD(P)-dependent oxidoreductase n=1 Tax=Pseudenhygromyxa sp. WMMC2535 TaxID=2712867 RepID=UPI001552D6B1|nr:SDR family oxidoreductase [Pseudenhygromyxa sp. WMMC2535]NVB41060.1 SDR family oxidoreductase [Pseudenhygromyxa sp. WMMC2535]